MKFIATILGILLIIFGTLLIPFPDYYNFQNQSITVDIKKHIGEEKGNAKAEEATKETSTTGELEKKVENAVKSEHKKGEVISVSLDPIIGVLSVLVGIILVFMGRRTHS